jgi:crotonobetainyl-CoA:carnitine CoA-transferase CaiB-like acyl-CoA transferase
MTSISPFGQTGPRRDCRASDLVSFHMSGYGYHLGGPVKDPRAEPPVKAAGRQADFVAGVNAALATMAGVFARAHSGHGQHVDVSVQEALIPFSFGQIAQYSYEGKVSNRRKADNPETGTVAVLPTADGHVAISPREEHLWERWIELIGNPDWASEERFKDREARVANWAELEPLLSEWTRTRTKDEIFRAAQAVRVPAFPVNTIDGVFASAQLAARAFFQEIVHPVAGGALYPTAPYRFSADGWELRRPAPLLGQHNDEILGQWLGCSREDLVRLRQAEVT